MEQQEKTLNTRKIIKSAVSLIVTLFMIMSFLISAYRIPTGSMERTLRIGDMLLVNKFYYGLRSPDWLGIPFTEIGFDIPWFKTPLFNSVKQGDVVVFKHFDEQMNQWLYYVKRCVALPGQTVEIVDKELFVDGKPFNDFYDTVEVDEENSELKAKARFEDPQTYPGNAIQRGIFRDLGNRDNFGPLTVPGGSYFMMGDNRDNSYDSRYWGFVTEDYIVGKPIMVYFSFDSDYPLTKLWKSVRWERIGYYIQ
jgi:signal peptidase I